MSNARELSQIATAVVVDSSKNVGIGTASPTTKLEISGTTLSTRFTAGAGLSAAAPDYSFANDGSMGMFRLPNVLGFSIAGTERMRIDSSGNVGIGTSSPLGKLKVAVGDVAPAASGNMNTGVIIESGFGSRAINIGSNNTAGYSWINAAYSNNSGIADNLVLMTGATERMRIDSSGNLLINTPSVGGTGGVTIAPGAALNGATQIKFNRANATGISYVIDFLNAGNSVGNINYTNTATTYSTTSDYRLKENVTPMTGALDTVAQLKPVTYNWKVDGSSGQGFIAHELQAVVPDCVTGEKDATRIEQYEITPAIPATFDEEGNELTPAVEAVMGEREVPVYQGIDTSFLVATLTAAIQEQQVMIEELKAKVAALEAA